jgi:CRP/FNR family transcriptional regulator
LNNFDFIDKLESNEKEYILRNSKHIELPKNTTLFTQGDTCKEILFLEEGTVKLFMYGAIDEVVPLYEINKGEQCIINISSTLSQTQAIASACTTSDIKAWLIPFDIVKKLMLTSPSYQEYIFSLFSLKFRALTTLIEDIKFKRLDTRVLEYLQSFNTFIIEVTHKDISIQLGTSRVVISRVLKDLEKKDFIKLHRKKIELL